MINTELLTIFINNENKIDELKNELSERKAEFDKQNEDLLLNIKDFVEQQELLKNEIKEEALVEYQETNIKQLTGGLGIRCMTNLVYEELEAFSWAKEHQLCLKLDSKAFENIAKSQSLDFVEIKEELVVTFPKELKL